MTPGKNGDVEDVIQTLREISPDVSDTDERIGELTGSNPDFGRLISEVADVLEQEHEKRKAYQEATNAAGAIAAYPLIFDNSDEVPFDADAHKRYRQACKLSVQYLDLIPEEAVPPMVEDIDLDQFRSESD